jgi:UDP-glucose 4-epimerase
MSFEGKRILVTGAAGFIGSNLSDALLAAGAEVIGYDNLWNGRMENLNEAMKNKKFSFFKADVRDYDMLLQVLQDVEIIFHEAAFTSVPQSVLMPQLCNDVNINGMLNILNAARRKDVKKVVFASSSSVYGDTPVLPKQEDMFCDPISPYGVAKLASERYCVSYNRVYGLNTTALRYFNVFGPRQKNSPYSGVIAIFLAKILDGKNPIIFGDGTQSRDFTYVKDVVNANMLAALKPESAGKVMNIAAGNPISLTDLTKIMLKACKREDLTIEYTDVRKGDILNSFGDVSRAKQILGYSPRYDAKSGFMDLLAEYLAGKCLL